MGIRWRLAALVAAVCVLAAGCGDGDKASTTQERFTPGSGSPSATASPSGSAAGSGSRPTFTFPSYFTPKFDYPPTGNARKDAVLADLRTFWEAWFYAALDPRRPHSEWNAYAENQAVPYFAKQLENFRKDGEGIEGTIAYYRPRFVAFSAKTAAVTQCEDANHFLSRNLKTGKRIGKPGTNYFARSTTYLARSPHGVWQVTGYTYKFVGASCAR